MNPVRCFTCGKVINYKLTVKSYSKWCCKRMILSAVNPTDDLLKYKN